MNRLSLEEFKEADKLPLIVVLDDVRSLHNVGSVFRSADAFRVEAVYLCGITATPPNAEIRQGVFVYSVEQVEGSTKLQELNTQHPINTQHPTPNTQHPSPHYAIVLGNEVKGVKQSVVDMSDGCIEIPQFGTKHSLNVSVTTGIVIWEFARQLLIK